MIPNQLNKPFPFFRYRQHSKVLYHHVHKVYLFHVDYSHVNTKECRKAESLCLLQAQQVMGHEAVSTALSQHRVRVAYAQ